MYAQKLSFDYAHTLHTVHIVHNAHSVHRSRIRKWQSCDCINFVRATDPSCGTAGFLVEAGEYLWENKKDEIFYDKQKKDHFMNHMFHGYDMDRTMLRIGAMNMMNHRVESPFIEYRDSLSNQNPDKDKYSLILANPPFKGSLDADIVSADLLKMCKTKKTELLFLTGHPARSSRLRKR